MFADLGKEADKARHRVVDFGFPMPPLPTLTPPGAIISTALPALEIRQPPRTPSPKQRKAQQDAAARTGGAGGGGGRGDAGLADSGWLRAADKTGGPAQGCAGNVGLGIMGVVRGSGAVHSLAPVKGRVLPACSVVWWVVRAARSSSSGCAGTPQGVRLGSATTTPVSFRTVGATR
jgi:hypothetical protein